MNVSPTGLPSSCLQALLLLLLLSYLPGRTTVVPRSEPRHLDPDVHSDRFLALSSVQASEVEDPDPPRPM